MPTGSRDPRISDEQFENLAKFLAIKTPLGYPNWVPDGLTPVEALRQHAVAYIPNYGPDYYGWRGEMFFIVWNSYHTCACIGFNESMGFQWLWEHT